MIFELPAYCAIGSNKTLLSLVGGFSGYVSGTINSQDFLRSGLKLSPSPRAILLAAGATFLPLSSV